jgi:hypothetical protein
MLIDINTKTLTLKYGEKEMKLTKECEFAVQIGFRQKGRYHNRYLFQIGDWHKSVFYFNSINIGNGFKKRLVVKEGDKVTKIVSVNS